MTLQDEINRMMAKKLASEVAYGAELARQFGFRIPRDLEFGFAATLVQCGRNSYEYKVSIRLLDVTHKFRCAGSIESLDGFIESCTREAGNIVSRYIDAHPEVKPSPDEAAEIAKRLGPATEDVMHEVAVDRALRAKLSEVR